MAFQAQGLLIRALLLFLWTKTSLSASENNKVAELPALGRMAQLGEFYDATDETFRNQLIFAKRIPGDMVKNVDNPSTETRFQVVDGMWQKITFLGVAASIAVSIKVGEIGVDVAGAASYIKDEKYSSKHVEGFLVHKTETCRDSVDLYVGAIRPYIDIMALMETNATHVVTGIYYGADVAVRFTDTNDEAKDYQDIKGSLSIAFSMMGISVSGSAQVNITDGEYTNSSSYELKISGDVPMKTIPRNAYEVLQFIETIPDLLQDINNGYGKPTRYVLTPLHQLQKVYQLEYMNAKIAAEVDEAILNDILTSLEAIDGTRQRLNDLQVLFDRYKETCMTPSIKKTLDELNNHFEARAGQFAADVRSGLVKVRAGNESMAFVQNIITEYHQHQNSTSPVNIRLDNDFEDGKRKIQFYEAFMKHDVQYMTESAYEADLVKTDDHVFYVLFYNLTLIDADVSTWEDNTNIFFNKLKRIWIKLKVVDCDFPLQKLLCSTLTNTVIYSYISNRKMSTNVLEDYRMYQRYESLQMPALLLDQHSNVYELGHMYSIGDNVFVESSLLERKNPPEIHYTRPTQKVRCNIVRPDYVSMFQALNVPPKLQIPILLGNLLSGSGLIFNVTVPGEDWERLNLVCVMAGERQEIYIDEEKFFDSLDVLALIDRNDASHIVQRREYTVNTVISLQARKSSAADVFSKLWRKLLTLKSALEVTYNGNTGAIISDPEYNGIIIHMTTDVFPTSPIPDVKDFTDIVRKFRGAVQDVFDRDETKGSPMYTLYPISNIQTRYSLITAPRFVAPNVTTKELTKLPGFYDRFLVLDYSLKKNKAMLDKYSECTPEDDRKLVTTIPQEFFSRWVTLTNQLSTSFAEFMETGYYKNLNKTVDDYAKVIAMGETADETLVEILTKLNETMVVYDIVGKSASLDYVTDMDKYNAAIGKSKESFVVYLLYFHRDWLQDVSTDWVENSSTFYGVSTKNSTTLGFIIDCHFFSSTDIDTCGSNRPVTQEYVEGNLACEDVVDRLKSEHREDPKAEDRLEQTLVDHQRLVSTSIAVIRGNIDGIVLDLTNVNATVDARVKELNEKLKDTLGNPPPINSTYIVYETSDKPDDLWTLTKWQDVSSNYPQIFGRVYRRFV